VVRVAENPLLVEVSDDAIDPYMPGIVLTGGLISSFALSAFVSSIAVDAAGVAWAATRSGLYRYKDGLATQYSTRDGLSTNWINDVAVRNASVRYLATADGLFKMVGSQFDKIMRGRFGVGGNVKSVLWEDPDVLWVGGSSEVYQIRDAGDGEYPFVAYPPSSYSSFSLSLDDRMTYFIVASSARLPTDPVIEIYLNGNRIHHGYDVSLLDDGSGVVRFKTALLPSDEVSVVARADLKKTYSFAQTDAEAEAFGVNTVRVKSVGVAGDLVFAATTGGENDVKFDDGTSLVPHDCVTLDTTPPAGCLRLVEQIDNSTVRLAVDNAEDAGSGLDKMLVSTDKNFVSEDGTTPVDPVAFSSSFLFSLLPAKLTSQSFTFPSGVGSKIVFFPNEKDMYAATSIPAVLY
jgi:hypothetical protein